MLPELKQLNNLLPPFGIRTHNRRTYSLIFIIYISFLLQWVPRWIAPNVLTFAGFLLTVLDFLLLSYYDYDYLAASSRVSNETSAEPLKGHTEVIPQSLWYLLAVFLFVAYTLGMYFFFNFIVHCFFLILMLYRILDFVYKRI